MAGFLHQWRINLTLTFQPSTCKVSRLYLKQCLLTLAVNRFTVQTILAVITGDFVSFFTFNLRLLDELMNKLVCNTCLVLVI